MNHPHAIFELRAGLMSCRVEAIKAVHSTGAKKLPQNAVKRDGIIGSMAANIKPTNKEKMT